MLDWKTLHVLIGLGGLMLKNIKLSISNRGLKGKKGTKNLGFVDNMRMIHALLLEIMRRAEKFRHICAFCLEQGKILNHAKKDCHSAWRSSQVKAKNETGTAHL